MSKVWTLEDNSSLINFYTGTMCLCFFVERVDRPSQLSLKVKEKKNRLNEYDPQDLDKFYEKELIRPALTTPIGI